MRLIFLILFSINFLFSGEAEDKFIKGNELYKSGKFKEAIEIYETLVDNGYSSSELYYNLGNSYYKVDAIGKSILYLERAKKLNSNDEDIDFNLNIARLKTVDKIEALPDFALNRFWKEIVNSMSSNLWAYISIALFIISIFSLSIFTLNSRSLIKKLSFLSFTVLLLISIIFSIASYQKLQNEKPGKSGIIINPTVYVKSAPSESSTDLFILHEGTKVSIQLKDQNWINFKLDDGTEGWIKESEIEKI